MSGVFWEADKQPNLCEAASGFTLSTVINYIAIICCIYSRVVKEFREDFYSARRRKSPLGTSC